MTDRPPAGPATDVQKTSTDQPPFPEREHHSEPCPGCDHPLGVHADTIGCVHGWVYTPEGFAVVDGCDCPLTLAGEYRPPRETEL